MGGRAGHNRALGSRPGSATPSCAHLNKVAWVLLLTPTAERPHFRG